MIIWRDTARPVRFFFLDGRVVIGMAFWLLHMSWFTFYISLASVIFFFIVERLGVTPPAALRFLKTYILGRRRRHMSLFILRGRARW